MSVSSVTARRLTAAAAVVAAMVGAVALPASAADHHPQRADRARVVISGVQYDSPGRDDRSNRSLNKEWVDITNRTRRAVNLDGWTLSDEDGHTYTFRHFRLDGGATVRVHTGVGRDSRTDVYQDRRTYVWNNDHDTATLRDDRAGSSTTSPGATTVTAAVTAVAVMAGMTGTAATTVADEPAGAPSR